MRTFCINCGKTRDIRKDVKGENVCAECGWHVKASSANLAAGTLINGFLLESKIGQGGMGVVYKAKQLNLERFVALKVLSDELAKDAEFVERFFREARAAASLSHPNIVQVYDAGSADGGIYYFAMELIEGETLETKIFRDGVVSPKDALNISLKVAQALEYAWDKQKLSHGDIKPENIMLNSSGGVKLADLGLAKTQHEDKTFKDGGIMATPLYAPPELIAGDIHRINFKSDMYSFGATFYNMLAGIPPFNDADTEVVLQKHLNERPKPLSEINPELNPSITKIIDSLLMKNPEDRPSSWKEVIKSIEKIHDTERKVFHKSHVNISPKEFEFIKKKPSTGPHSYADVVMPANKGMKAVKTLALIIIFLSVVLLGLYVTSLDKSSQNGKSAGTSRSFPEMGKDWGKLKNRINFELTPEQALAEIDDFIIKNEKKIDDVLLADIKKEKNNLLKKKESADTQGRLVNDFTSNLQSLKESLKKDFSKEQDEGLAKLVTAINNVFENISKNSTILVMEKEDREFLINKSLELSKVLQGRQNERDRLLLEKAQKEEKDRLEAERIKKEEQLKKRAELLSQNRLLDEYFLILSDTSATSDYKLIVKALSDWTAKQNVPADYKKKAQTLLDNCPPEYPSDIFIRNSAFFTKDTALTFEDAPADYKFSGIDEKKGFLFEILGGKSKSNIGWGKISPRNYILLIKTLVSIPGISLSDTDKKTIMSYCVLRGVGNAAMEVMSSMPMSPDELKIWTEITSELKNIAKEKELIQKFASLMMLKSENRNEESAQVLQEIMGDTSDTVFRKRYGAELDLLVEEMKDFSPVLSIFSFLAESKKLLLQQKYLPALTSASTAKSRVDNYASLPAKIRGDIDFCIAASLAAMSPSIVPKEVKDIQTPFSPWETENPAFQMAAYQNVRNSGRLKDNPKMLASLEMCGYISVGCWNNALELFGSEALDVESIVNQQSTVGTLASSFLFADGLLMMRYRGSRVEMKSVLDHMFQSIHMSGNKYSNALISLEYALMIREFKRVISDTGSLKFSSDDENFRISLLRLLAQLNASREPVSEEFTQEVKQMSEKFGKNETFAADMEFIKTIEYMNQGNNELPEAQIASLKSDKIKFKALCSRLLATAVAKKLAVAHGVEPLNTVLSVVQKNTGNNLAAKPLLLQDTAIRIGIAKDAPSMLLQVNRFLDNPNIGAISLYPKLKILQTSLRIASGELQNNDETIGSLKKFIEASGVSSGDEKKIPESIRSGTYDMLAREFMEAEKYDDAAWTVICGSLANIQDKDKAKALFNELHEKEGVFEWYEIFLMQSVKKKIFKF